MARTPNLPKLPSCATVSTSEMVAAQKLAGQAVFLGATASRSRLGFQSEAVNDLSLDFEGIVGNRHRGFLRKADARTPYLKRGTQIRNQRHLSLVSVEDLSEIATRLGLETIAPKTLGANVCVAGIPRFSHLPRGTKLFFPSGAILIIEDQNAPCSLAGEAVMLAAEGNAEIKRQFPKLAHGLRGLVASVEHPGLLSTGDTITAHLPAQWLYRIDTT